MLGIIAGIQSIDHFQQGSLCRSNTCPVHVVLPHTIRHIEHNDDVCTDLNIFGRMTGDIQSNRIGAVPVRFDILIGFRRNTRQRRIRRSRRGIAGAAFRGIVCVDMAAVRDLHRVFGRHFIGIVRYDICKPFAVVVFPNHGIRQHDPIIGFRHFILCAGVVVSADINGKVY